MAVPRPVLLALLGLAVCVTAFMATRGARSEDAAVSTPTPPVTAPQAPKTKSEKPARGERSRSPADGQRGAETPARKPDAPDGTPAEILPVVKALGRDQVVVLLFTRAGAADDTGTRRAVASVRGMRGVAVHVAGVEQLASYRPILSGVGVSQVPAVVIVRPGHQAKLVEGYIDERSLRQRVADALR
jgi:hypothetical protein